MVFSGSEPAGKQAGTRQSAANSRRQATPFPENIKSRKQGEITHPVSSFCFIVSGTKGSPTAKKGNTTPRAEPSRAEPSRAEPSRAEPIVTPLLVTVKSSPCSVGHGPQRYNFPVSTVYQFSPAIASIFCTFPINNSRIYKKASGPHLQPGNLLSAPPCCFPLISRQ